MHATVSIEVIEAAREMRVELDNTLSTDKWLDRSLLADLASRGIGLALDVETAIRDT
jgi:hypothetical protein